MFVNKYHVEYVIYALINRRLMKKYHFICKFVPLKIIQD